MNTLKDRSHCRCGSSVVPKDSKGLFRPEHLARREFAAKTAGVTESLSFRQISLAPTQFLLRPFTLGDIHRSTDDFNELAGRAENRMTCGVNVPYRATR